MSELSDAINEMRNMRESYNQIGAAAEAYNAGKVELAENITAKGIPASATETLPELAEKVGIIAQTQTILDGGEVMAAQQFGDGALWNLYQVLADMKTRFMGNGDYAALIVCRYQKGYDSLVLQGADGYFTCDGDYYDYASPTHVWHDADNDKMDRWVAFLYRQDGARLDITNTAISPRSMYIGGHIGTIEYFVNGRLNELVCGVEETDVVDYLFLNNYTQNFDRNCIIRNIKTNYTENPTKIGKITIDSTGSVVVGIDHYGSQGGTTTNPGTASLTADNCSDFKYFGQDARLLWNYCLFSCANASVISIDVKNISSVIFGTVVKIGANTTNLITTIEALTQENGHIEMINGYSVNLILVSVGEMRNHLFMTSWNPTNVLADATKKTQLIENIKNHILARVSDATGGTQLVFTVSTNMYNSIASEQIEWQGETMSLADAFLTKNWLLAGA